MTKASAILSKIKNKLVTYDICFSPGAKASHTLRFDVELEPNMSVHIYVDIDEERPIALTLIHSSSVDIVYNEVPSLYCGFVDKTLQFCHHLIELDKNRYRLIELDKNPNDIVNQIVFYLTHNFFQFETPSSGE